MKHVLITGGAGFIGSHTADLLLKKGIKVTVLDNLATGKLAHLDGSNQRLEFIQADIIDYPRLSEVIKNCDCILHLAALPSVLKSIEDPIHSLKVNTMGFLRILQTIREVNPTVRLVYASSAAVYGAQKELPARDDKLLTEKLLSPYALEKVTNEHYARLYAELFGIKSLGLRYFNVYGTRQDPTSFYSGVISKFISNYQSDQPLTVFGDGTQARDFIHVSDVARANELALQSQHTGVVNIATGKMETLKQLIQYISAAGRKPAEIKYAESRVGDIYHSYGSVDQAEQRLGFRYSMDLAEGIKTMLGVLS